LSRMRRDGAWFGQARSTVLPTVTGVGHATIGTGADPRIHGITVNNLYNRVSGKSQQAYDRLDPRELMALTLADIWNLETDGRAIINGHGGAIRATAGLVGRGACLVNGRAVIAASYSTADAGWETNPECYRMPESLKAFNGKRYWGEVGGTWMGHDITSPTKFRASAVFQRFEAEALLAVLERESIGADETTDLVMVNMKGPDYTGHAYGPDSPEIEATLTELDRQMTRLIELLDRKAGAGQTVFVVTADHGMPPAPRDGRRVYPEEVVAAIHQRFDPDAKAIVKYYEDAANNELYIDTGRLQALGVSLKDVARMLETLPHYAAAFTEDEVQAAQSRLPRR
jgi:predicted AlkP superfamily pyrophosphatase or phosphodiesterase